MPVHDWTNTEAGIFHDFHSSWIVHLKEALNNGLLPGEYYAQAEQHAGGFIADVLTLQMPSKKKNPPPASGGIAVATAPPQVKQRFSPAAAYQRLQRQLSIRHVSGHEVIALIEILSPGNKDRAKHIEQFIDKAEMALSQGVHLLLIDLFPPGTHDPLGVPALLWDRFDEAEYPFAQEPSLTISSYLAEKPPEFFIEPVAVGSRLIDMPLFLNADDYVNVPLEATYMQAFRGMPRVQKELLESK